MNIREVIENRIQANRQAWPMCQNPLKQVDLNRVVNEILCSHDFQPIFNDNLRQYFRCTKCTAINT